MPNPPGALRHAYAVRGMASVGRLPEQAAAGAICWLGEKKKLPDAICYPATSPGKLSGAPAFRVLRNFRVYVGSLLFGSRRCRF